MGRRGPRPKPEALRQAKRGEAGGSTRSKPQPPAAVDDQVPEPPQWLRPLAAEEWHRVVPQLHELGLLARLDLSVVEAYCQTWARWREAETHLVAEGATYTITTKQGDQYEQASPWVAISRQSLAELRRLAAEFGMTPAGRHGLKLKPQRKSKLAEFQQRAAPRRK